MINKSELTGLSKSRLTARLNACTGGWALYAEQIGRHVLQNFENSSRPVVVFLFLVVE